MFNNNGKQAFVRIRKNPPQDNNSWRIVIDKDLTTKRGIKIAG